MITVLGRIFPTSFLCPRPDPRPMILAHEMTPDNRRGSFQFLGFNHWVTSLSAGSTGLYWFGWNPFRSIHVLQLSLRLAFM